jgi:hypothetical protein
MRCTNPEESSCVTQGVHTVAVTWARLNEPRRTGRSGSNSEGLIDETDSDRPSWFPQDAMTTADHPHDLETFDRCGSWPHSLEAACRLDHALEYRMIGLNEVVQIIRCPMLDVMP